jgi:hypothetical protein
MVRARAVKKTAAQAAPKIMVDQLVTPEAQRHGDYRIATVSITEGEHGPAQKGEQSAVMNYGGSTVDRWAANGSLEIYQLTAIAIFRRAHMMAWGSVSYGSNWTRMLSGVSGGLGGRGAETQHEAKDDLDRMDRRVFDRCPRYVYDTWLNVVMYDMPAGVAGKLLGFKSEKSARAGALMSVRTTCDMIAMEWGL